MNDWLAAYLEFTQLEWEQVGLMLGDRKTVSALAHLAREQRHATRYVTVYQDGDALVVGLHDVHFVPEDSPFGGLEDSFQPIASFPLDTRAPADGFRWVEACILPFSQLIKG